MRRKPCALAALFLLHACIAVAQSPTIPEFGKVTKEELLMKECSFEKDAAAMVLVNEETVTFHEDRYGSKTVYEVRSRIKIFNNKGYDYASVSIKNAKSGSSKVTDVEAFVYNLTGDGTIKTERVSKDQIFKEKETGKRKVNSLRFTFPDLQPGSVVEYKYIRTKKDVYGITPWLFQAEIPTRLAECNVIVPPDMDFNTRVVANRLASEDSNTTSLSSATYKVKKFVFQNVPSFKEEPYMSSAIDNLNRVEFGLSHGFFNFGLSTSEQKWQLLGSWLRSYYFFGMQYNMAISGTEQAVDSIKKFSTNAEKISAVYELVKQNIKWNDEQFFYAENVENAWETKSGSSAEINLLILNLLRKVGVECKPLLISTRDNGKPDIDFPSLGQFNGVDVLITDSVNNFVLDGTQQHQSYIIPPLNILNREAFVVDSFCHWVVIADNIPLMNSSTYIKAELDSAGVLNGSAEISMKDYAKAEELKGRDKDEKEKKEDAKDFLNYDSDDLIIDSIGESDSADVMKPLQMKLKFHCTLTNNDDFYFLNPFFLAMFRKNPFIGKERQYDIDFGCMQRFLTYMKINIPENFSIEEIPKSTLLRTADTSIAFRKDVSYANRQLDIRYYFELNSPLFTKENYPGVKDFFDKIYALINQQILLKKKE